MYMYIYCRYATIPIPHHHDISSAAPPQITELLMQDPVICARSLTVPELVAFSLERDRPNELGMGLRLCLAVPIAVPKRGAMARPIIR